MTVNDSLALRIVDALDAGKIPYLLAGSFASNVYGIPRSTKDADFVIQHRGGVGAQFAQQLGEEFELDPQLSFETVTGTYRQLVRHRQSAFKIEIFLLSADPYDQERFGRRREENLSGRKVWLLSPEDVIITKLRWGRGKDQADVRDVMAVQHAVLDWKYIQDWCARHGTLARMEEIRRSATNSTP